MSSELNTFADKPNVHGSVIWNIPKRNEATVLAEKNQQAYRGFETGV